MCGVLRLALFPLVGGQDRFVGLPIPPAGLFVAALAATSVLMVSTVPFPAPAALLGPKNPRPGGQPAGSPVKDRPAARP